MWAAAQAHPQAVQALLERRRRRARPLARRITQTVTSEVTQRAGREELNYTVPRGGSTALLFAARSGDAESARLLRRRGRRRQRGAARRRQRARRRRAQRSQPAWRRCCSRSGANPNAATIGYTALHAAVLRSDLDAGEGAARASRRRSERGHHQGHAGATQQPGLRAAARRCIGATPYLLAAKFLEPDIMRALAAAGADTRQPMKDGATPLMAAAGMGIVAAGRQDERRGTDRRGLPSSTAARSSRMAAWSRPYERPSTWAATSTP